MQSIIKQLPQLSIEQLRELNERVISEIKLKRKQLAKQKRGTFSVGDEVKINSETETEFGTIINIKRTRAVVDIDGKGRYDVPLTMMELA